MASRALCNQFEAMLREMDWVGRHDLWDRMNRRRYFRDVMCELRRRFSPDELLEGEKTGKTPSYRKIRLPSTAMVRRAAPVDVGMRRLEDFGFRNLGEQ